MSITKRCTKCKQELDVSFFAPDYRLLGGLQSRCKACKAKLTRIWQKNNPERVKELKRDDYARKKNGTPTPQQKWNANNAEKLR